MAEITADHLRQYRRYQLEHRVRNLRPTLRRKGVSTEDRAKVQAMIVDAMQELSDVFGVREVKGWRAYPASLSFRVTGHRTGVEFQGPPRKGKKREHTAPKQTQSELLDALQASLAQQLQRTNGR